MVCPQCQSEYREGFVRCTDCDVALVSELEPAPRKVELTKVFETYDAALTPVVESLLRDAGIEVLVKNALNAMMPGTGSVFGAVQYWVDGDREDEVRELLRDLGDPAPSPAR